MVTYALFKDILATDPRSKLKAGEGREEGEYAFYTSSPSVSKRTHKALYKKDALIIGTGGAASIHFSDKPFSTTAECMVARLHEEMKDRFNLKYIYYYLLCHIEILENGFQGMGIRHIQRSYIQNINIPAYPLHTQNLIVSVLDKITAIIARRENVLQMLFDFRKSLFLETFGDTVLDREKHAEVKLHEVVYHIEMGKSPVCESNTRQHSSQIAVLKQSAVTKKYFDPEQHKLLHDNREEKIDSGLFVQQNDLLFSRKNTPELVGSTAFVFEPVKNLLIPDTMYRLYYAPKKISGVYLYFLFNDANFRKQFRAITTGTMVSMSNISVENLRELTILTPTQRCSRRSKSRYAAYSKPRCD